MDDAGGLWLVVTVIGAIVLGAALTYGVMMWHTRRRDRGTERLRDRETERLYERGERKEQE